MVHPYNRRCQTIYPRDVMPTEAGMIMRKLCCRLCFKRGVICLPQCGATTWGKNRADVSWVGGHFFTVEFLLKPCKCVTCLKT